MFQSTRRATTATPSTDPPGMEQPPTGAQSHPQLSRSRALSNWWATTKFDRTGNKKNLRWIGFVASTFLAAGLIYFVIFSGVLPFSDSSDSANGGGRSTGVGSQGLDGCYDSSGNVYSIFLDENYNVNQTSLQCKAVLNLIRSFGFPLNANQNCSQNTTVWNGNDSTSMISAQFCNEETVYSLEIQNPPVSMAAIPSELSTMPNISFLAIGNALYGDNILTPLFSVLQSAKYFQILNLTGSTENHLNATRVLNGSIPELPAALSSPKAYFIEFWIANNNISGSFPLTLADNMQFMTVANNSLMTGPLPASFNENLTHKEEWTEALRCSFTNTSLCIPSSWGYQPACLRDKNLTLPTCDGSIKKNLTLNDPMRTSGLGFGGGTLGQGVGDGSSSSMTGVVSNVSKVVAFVFGFTLLASFGVVAYIQALKLKKTRTEGHDGIAGMGYFGSYAGYSGDTLELRRPQEFGLPAYTPTVVQTESNHNVLNSGDVSTNPLNETPSSIIEVQQSHQ
ncbi:hypothetical protein BC830DRAFT_547269 [Chytriomyces sp. MP71]|nr:hypothetical protein BC830DRAFT_547269 [Chytriomyces sp. MP71]